MSFEWLSKLGGLGLMKSENSPLPPYFLYGSAAGFVGSIGCFWLAKEVLVPKLSPQSFRDRFEKLSKKEKYAFYSLFPSTVHALAQVAFHPAWISLGFSPGHLADRVGYFDETWPSFFMGVFSGYLMGDFASNGPTYLGPVFSLHHLSAAACWTLGGYLRNMQFYASLLQYCELSTIFMNYRQLVLTAGYSSDSKVGTMAGLFFIGSFFVVRVAPIPRIIYYWLGGDFASIRDSNGTLVALANTAFLAIHVGLQSYWWSLMMKKLAALFQGKPTGDDEKKKEN